MCFNNFFKYDFLHALQTDAFINYCFRFMTKNQCVTCPIVTKKYDGSQDGIHILSLHTAAGDDVGWEYLTLATNSKFSLSCFIKHLSMRYELNRSVIHFMSRSTFTDRIFGWMVNCKIDFREQCEVCRDKIDTITADGTMIGISFNKCSVTSIKQHYF